MIVLDLFCGAGGAARGYADAGHTVIGVDLNRQRRFPYTFWRMDALEVLHQLLNGKRLRVRDDEPLGLDDFDFIHASPPCQFYSVATSAIRRNDYPDLIEPTRELLNETGLPYVIENVVGAPLDNPTILCGRMFDLHAYDEDGTRLILDRHRLFEANWNLRAPHDCRPHDRTLQVGGVYGGGRSDRAEARFVRRGGYTPAHSVREQLMGIDWMTGKELTQAIPPAYTRWIAMQHAAHEVDGVFDRRP